MIQIGVYTTFCQEEGILVQKYRDDNGRCIAILFRSIGVRGRCDSPDKWETDFYTPPMLGGAALFDNSAPAVYKNLCADSEKGQIQGPLNLVTFARRPLSPLNNIFWNQAYGKTCVYRAFGSKK